MKILKTNRGKNVYRVEENADGTLRLLSEDSAEALEAINELKTLSKGQFEPSEGNIRRVLRLFNKVYFCLWPEKPDFKRTCK